MDHRDQQQQSRWRPTRGQLLWAGSIIGVVAVLLLIRLGYTYPWTGFGKSKLNEAVHPAKTLWDWLGLLIVPVVLAIGGYFFTRSESRATREAAERRAQDETLQAYLDQMGQMLLDATKPLRRSTRGDSLQALARARTLAVLRRLDGARKGTVLQFLYESGLIHRNYPKGKKHFEFSQGEPVVERRIVDLSGADLSGARLEGASLSGAELSNTNLRRSHLGGGSQPYPTYLTSVNFSEANLEEADLSGADLSGATVKQTNLRRASLRRVLLRATDLSGADLSGADLTGAVMPIRSAFPAVSGKGLEDIPSEEVPPREWQRRADALASLGREEVANQELDYMAETLKGATMPTGQKYEDWLRSKNENWLKPEYVPESLKGVIMPDGQPYEDWIKSEGGGEDGENRGSS